MILQQIYSGNCVPNFIGIATNLLFFKQRARSNMKDKSHLEQD